MASPNDRISIIVSGTQHKWATRTISYLDVATLFEPSAPKHPEITYTITYEQGPSANPEGVLAPGQTIQVREGMVFDVSRTGQS